MHPTHLRARAALLSLVAGLIISAVAMGVAPPLSRATSMIPPYPVRAKEASLAYRGGVFHLYYTRGIYFVPFDSTWNDLGHAISVDLINWSTLPPVIPRRPDKWDNLQIWSPDIVDTGTLYYMFYTGVSHRPPNMLHHQRIGLATSPDLVNWTRFDRPVFSCSDAPWTDCDSTAEGAGDFRDAHVMPDPDTPGHWLMYYTTKTAVAPSRYVIGLARSSGDLTEWVDAGPMCNTDSLHTGSQLIESPDLIEHGGLWYLLYTTSNQHTINFETATSPVADSTQWSPNRALADEVTGFSTDESFGPEHYSINGHDLYYMANSAFDGIQILEYAWLTPPHFDLIEPYTITGVDPRPTPGVTINAIGSPREVRLRIELPSAMRADLSILDASGRAVRHLHRGQLAAGATVQRWDGLSDSGTAAASGVYFAVLDTPLGRRNARFARLR